MYLSYIFFGAKLQKSTPKKKKKPLRLSHSCCKCLWCTLLNYVEKFSISLEIDIPYHGFIMKINSKLVINVVFIHHDFINDTELIQVLHFYELETSLITLGS